MTHPPIPSSGGAGQLNSTLAIASLQPLAAGDDRPLTLCFSGPNVGSLFHRQRANTSQIHYVPPVVGSESRPRGRSGRPTVLEQPPYHPTGRKGARRQGRVCSDSSQGRGGGGSASWLLFFFSCPPSPCSVPVRNARCSHEAPFAMPSTLPTCVGSSPFGRQSQRGF